MHGRALSWTLPTAWALLGGLVGAQSGPQMSDLAFIEGHWVAEHGNDELEEIWSSPVGDSMMGMFRWIKDGKVWLYELLCIRKEGEGIVFRFRHFSNELVPWEPEDEPLTFSLVGSSEGEAVFENPDRENPRRYSFIKDGDDGLRVHVQGYREGRLEPGDVFEYQRK